jgi:hypothetical protein
MADAEAERVKRFGWFQDRKRAAEEKAKPTPLPPETLGSGKAAQAGKAIKTRRQALMDL